MKLWLQRLAICLALAGTITTQGAPLEDLESMLKEVASDFRAMATRDAELRELRQELLAPETSTTRKQELFDSYRGRLAEQIERQQGLVERVQAALDAASGLPDETGTDLRTMVAGFDTQAAAWEEQIRQLQVNAEALAAKEGVAGQMGRLQERNLKLLQSQFAAVRAARAKLVTGNEANGLGHVRDMLEALHATALARETAMFFEFTITSQNSQLFTMVTEIRSLYDQLIGPRDYTTYMRDIATADVEAANAMIQATQMVANEAMPMPEIDEPELQAVEAEIEDMEAQSAYEINGTFFYFSPPDDRWYILDETSQRAWLPIDPMANTGRYVRMHANGHLYSEAPIYDRPRQLTFTDDWQSELSTNP